jgi:hypothetical protein
MRACGCSILWLNWLRLDHEIRFIGWGGMRMDADVANVAG